MHVRICFWFMVQDYFRGSKRQKRSVIDRLTQVIIENSRAVDDIMEVLKSYSGEHASEMLLHVAEKLDADMAAIHPDRDDYRQVMLNAIRFYSSAGFYIKNVQSRRKCEQGGLPAETKRVQKNNDKHLWSFERIREELITLYRENRCVRKSTADKLMMPSEVLRQKLFPRFRIDEERIKKEWIQEALLKNNGNIKDATQKLGIHIRTLRNYIRKYSLEKFCKNRPPKKQRLFVDQLQGGKSFFQMYQKTLATASRNLKNRKSYLQFFHDVDRYFHARFYSEKERRSVYRYLRFSVKRHRIRIQILFRECVGEKIPFELKTATRYKFCNLILGEIIKAGTPENILGKTQQIRLNANAEEILMALKAWALRHWREDPISWKVYRGSAQIIHNNESQEENITMGSTSYKL